MIYAVVIRPVMEDKSVMICLTECFLTKNNTNSGANMDIFREHNFGSGMHLGGKVHNTFSEINSLFLQ